MISFTHQTQGILSREQARAAIRWLATHNVARVVVVSDFARKALTDGGLPAGLVTTIRNGLLLEHYLPDEPSGLRDLLGVPEFEPVVGIVGRFTPWKGQEFFLRLAQAWAARGWLGQFVLVGQTYPEDKEYEKSLLRFVEDHQLHECVRFAPFQTNVASTLRALDVLVHASTRPEPLGRVILEAMSVGVPVLAARAGGVPEIITDGVNGVLAEPGNLEDYLNKLRAMIDGGTEMARMRMAAQDTVKERFTADRMFAEFERVVDEVGVPVPAVAPPDGR
jgi:glycosyltransferase involved in cell wall biosynthesis